VPHSVCLTDEVVPEQPVSAPDAIQALRRRAAQNTAQIRSPLGMRSVVEYLGDGVETIAGR